MWKTQDIKKEVGLEELEMSLNVEEYVGPAALDCLEVSLLDAAIVEVEPSLAVGSKCSVMT